MQIFSVDKEAYAVSLNCFLRSSGEVNQAMKLLFTQQSFDILIYDGFDYCGNTFKCKQTKSCDKKNRKVLFMSHLCLIKHGYPKNHNDCIVL